MTLPNTDLFIINRSRTNYQVDYNNLKQYIPGMPAGARCLFYMDSAPYGWSLDNNSKFTEATVRVVSGSGGANGGSQNFSNVFKSWTTSVPTHNHGVSAGSHKHTGAVSHNHSVRDPGHTHTTSRLGSPINYKSDMVDLAEPLYSYGSTDGEEDLRNYKISVGGSSVTTGTDLDYPDRQTPLDDFVEDAYKLINDNEFIDYVTNSAFGICEPSSASLIPALLSKPIFLPAFDIYKDLKFGPAILEYPGAFYIQDIENILEIFRSFDYDVYKKDIYNWKVKCVGPPPITNTSKNLANTFNRVLNNE